MFKHVFSKVTKVFVSSAKHVGLQHRMLSSGVRLLYLEVSSSNYLVTTDKKAFIFYYEVDLETPKKVQKLGKKFLLNFISSWDGPEKVQKQGRDKRTQED